MLVDLSKLEKRAVTKVFLDLMYADGEIAIEESAYFDYFQKALGVSNQEVEEAQFISVTRSLALIKEMKPEHKNMVAQMMYDMIKSDGDINPKELTILHLVCKAADIPFKTA